MVLDGGGGGGFVIVPLAGLPVLPHATRNIIITTTLSKPKIGDFWFDGNDSKKHIDRTSDGEIVLIE